MRSRLLKAFAGIGLAVMAGLMLSPSSLADTTPAPATSTTLPSASWPKYLHDLAGTGANQESVISADSAPSLKRLSGWPVNLGGRPITTQPVLANGLIYIGGWDGYEYALRPDGSVAWKQYLGRTRNCYMAQAVSTTTSGTVAGIVSTGALSTETSNGRQRSVLYVGGGGNVDAGGATVKGSAEIIALDAITGEVLWRTPLGASPNHLIWSSPTVYDHSVYAGVSSFDDCPLIQGKLVKLDAATGAVQATFVTGPAGCETASIWGSATIDAAAGAVYIGTGNSRPCSVFGPTLGRYSHTKRGLLLLGLAGIAVLVAVFWPKGWLRLGFWLAGASALASAALGAFLIVGPTVSINREYSVSFVKLDARDLQVIASWKVPQSDAGDYDFGSTPTLFTGTVTPGGAPRQLVGIPNKNGLYYVFDRAHVSDGPVASIRLANAKETDPTKGNGSVSPSAWDGHRLYVAGGEITVNGQPAPGSVAAYDPNDLSTAVWTVAAHGPVLGAVSTAGGVVAVGDGSFTTVVSAANGTVLFNAPVVKAGLAVIYGAPAIANGHIYQGDTAGYLYAYGINGE